MNKKEILKFIRTSILWLEKNGRGCCHHYLDNDLGIFVGWTQTSLCLLEEPKLIHSIKYPEYIIIVGVKVRRLGDENDYDRLDYPWSTENFCDINFFLPAPEMTDADYLKETTMLLDAYKETVKKHKKGIVRYKYFD